MSSIDRVGQVGSVSRNSPSSGLEAQEIVQSQDDAASERNPQVDAAAKLYEKEFLREMVRAMRGTVDFGTKPSMGESIYRDELDANYVESWGEHGGVGLANLIYDQVMSRYFGSEDGKKLKNETPVVPLSDRDVLRVSRAKTQPGTAGQIPLKVDLAASPGGQPAKIESPWSGQVISNTRLDGGKTALTIKHGPSLRSTFVFDGVSSGALDPGSKVEKGGQLGVLSPEIRSFFWNLQTTQANYGSALSSQQAGLDAGRVQK